MSENQETKQQNNKVTKSYSYESARVMSVAFELGFIIALPIVFLGLAGKWMDARYGTGYFIYLGIITAILLTSTLVYRRFAAMVEKLRDAAGIKNSNENESKKD